ncbi:T-cell surface glycoprotein CD1b2 [Bienertia sinuspersici]
MAKTKTGEPMKKNKKKLKKSGINKVSMKSIAPPKDNPFETFWSRCKFDVIGKKRKGEECRISQARMRAIDRVFFFSSSNLMQFICFLPFFVNLMMAINRKSMSKVEKLQYFVDKRIGEQNDTLCEFDNGILRSQRERRFIFVVVYCLVHMKIKKTNKFNLPDSEEDDLDT